MQLYGQNCVLLLEKTVWAKFWASFFTNSSGHPVWYPRFLLLSCFFRSEQMKAKGLPDGLFSNQKSHFG
jgi:hypothetical protein